jgi:hypothetical protein
LDSPKKRLLAFVDSVHGNREQLAQAGCPLGGLCSELHKQGGALAKTSARSRMPTKRLSADPRFSLNAICPNFTMFPVEFPLRILKRHPNAKVVAEILAGA